jgi:class I fructose-bisphosphate aldolase
VKLEKLFTRGRTLILAYDHGLEHGPSDFNLTNVNPEFIFDLAEKGKFNALATGIGVAEKYHSNFKHIPLIVKLNGKTNLSKDIISVQNCSIKRADRAGASAVGYTIYPGSPHEARMFSEFGAIVEEAHNAGFPVIAWVYPRGPSAGNELATEHIAYAARVGLELGADVIKIKYNNDFEGFKWVVDCAGKTRVVVAGGSKAAESNFLKMTYDVVQAGASGLAVGRNVWQNAEPLKITKAIKRILFENEKLESAMDLLKK